MKIYIRNKIFINFSKILLVILLTNTNHQAYSNMDNGDYESPLINAASKGEIDIIKHIKEKGDVNLQDKNGYTALMAASEKGHCKIVRELIRVGADVNIIGRNGKTAAMLAFQNSHADCLGQLIKEGAHLRINNMKELKSLIGITKHMNQHIHGYLDYHVPLVNAALRGEIDEVKKLIGEGADINEKHQYDWDAGEYGGSGTNTFHSALTIASREGHDDIVDLLIKEGVQLDMIVTSDYCPGQTLADRSPHLICDQLNGYSAVTFAALNGHCKIVGRLINAGADPYFIGSNRYRKPNTKPIFDCIDELIGTEGLNHNHQGPNGQSILMMTIREHRNDSIHKLVKMGTKLNLQDDDGYTALMFACLEGNTELVRQLIEANADINIIAKSGKTAASLAFKHNHIYCLEQLLLKGANLHIDNKNELKSFLNMKSKMSSGIGKNLKLTLGDNFPLSSVFRDAIIAGEMETVKKHAPSYFGYWGNNCTPDKECALALAVVTEQIEILTYLCDVWNVPIYPSSDKNILETILDWICFLEPTNLSLYLNGNI